VVCNGGGWLPLANASGRVQAIVIGVALVGLGGGLVVRGFSVGTVQAEGDGESRGVR